MGNPMAKESTTAKPKRADNTPKHYRCRVEVSVISVKDESSLRFGPGMLVRAEELKRFMAKGGPLEGRADCFEPVEPEET